MRLPLAALASLIVGLAAGCQPVLPEGPRAADTPAAGPSVLASEVNETSEEQLQRLGLHVVGRLESDLTQDGVPEEIVIAAADACAACDVRRVIVFHAGRPVLDVEARLPRVVPLPGRYGVSIRETISAADSPPCCEGDQVAHVFIWDGTAFVPDRRDEALRAGLTRQVNRFLDQLDPAERRQIDVLALDRLTPAGQRLLLDYQQRLAAVCSTDGFALLRAYRHWWQGRLVGGETGPVREPLPQHLLDPRALDQFVSRSLMRE